MPLTLQNLDWDPRLPDVHPLDAYLLGPKLTEQSRLTRWDQETVFCLYGR